MGESRRGEWRGVEKNVWLNKNKEKIQNCRFVMFQNYVPFKSDTENYT